MVSDARVGRQQRLRGESPNPGIDWKKKQVAACRERAVETLGTWDGEN
jgi:hypothetical protein